MLVALEVVSISTNLADHMFQTSVGGEHSVGTLRFESTEEKENNKEKPPPEKVHSVHFHTPFSFDFKNRQCELSRNDRQ